MNKPRPMRDLRTLLTPAQRANLQRLENKIPLARSIAGAEKAFAALINEEKRLGVYDPRNTQTPRWSTP